MIGYVVALLAGAGLMYILDPQWGRRRRGLLRDQVMSLRNRTQQQIEAARRNVENRTEGAVSEATAAARRQFENAPVSNEVLVARVRSELGRVVTHPGAIEVVASQGNVMLRGPILAHEVDPLLTVVRRVPGVVQVENLLQAYTQPNNIPGLQGSGERSAED